ncbi:MAG: HTH-type transcriptional regulator, IolR family [Anaerocolumna sp.]|nr:HTH-type transcriptional regulator, IolR family [Anaerocolumna sp.]
MGMKSYRIRQMEQYILEHDLVSMEELCRTFNISMNTVRLDVAHLVSKGTIRKVYGGVCSNQKGNLIPFEERESKNIQSKIAVSKTAASLVQNDDIIYIDSGTTTMYMVDFLSGFKNVTVVTNSLNVINRAVLMPDLTVISLPGTLERKTNSFVSGDTVRILEKYNISKAFMASSGIDMNGMVTNSSPLEYEIKQTAIMNSKEVNLLIDSSKFGKSAMLTYANITEMSRVIVDDHVDTEMLHMCEKRNVAVLLAQSEDI